MSSFPVVAIVKTKVDRYPRISPFHPPEKYPEYPFLGPASDEQNGVYAAVRQLFALLEMDKNNWGRPEWNPFREIVHPGDKVVIKPNFVMDRHWGQGDVQCLITHGSIIRAVIDYVIIALQGRGHIIVADAPMDSCDFSKIVQISGFDRVQQFCKEQGITVDLVDLRTRRCVLMDHVAVRQEDLVGDPVGYAVADLEDQSSFMNLHHQERLRGSDYDCEGTIAHHYGGHHAYYMARTVLDADVVINLPKLKTHEKAGVTLNLKNAVGISGDKNWIPHYRVGVPSKGGDEFPERGLIHQCMCQAKDAIKRRVSRMNRLELFLICKARRVHKAWSNLQDSEFIGSGGWYGNDTLWRSILDLNRILLYANRDGIIQAQKQRRLFSLVDGIVAGERNGPLYPQAKPCGVLLAGEDLLAVDLCAARLMGFDFHRIPYLAHALEPHPLRLGLCGPEEILVRSNIPTWVDLWANNTDYFLNFIPPDGWRRHIEIGD